MRYDELRPMNNYSTVLASVNRTTYAPLCVTLLKSDNGDLCLLLENVGNYYQRFYKNRKIATKRFYEVLYQGWDHPIAKEMVKHD